MAHSAHDAPQNLEMRFAMPARLRTVLLALVVGGLALAAIGLFIASLGTPAPRPEGAGAATGADWVVRLWANVLLNNVYWLGLGLLALFFLAVQTISDAGWYIVIKRVMEAMAGYIPVGAVLILLMLLGNHYLYSWRDTAKVMTDEVLKGKSGWLNFQWYAIRTMIYLVIWSTYGYLFRRASLLEDQNGGLRSFKTGIVLAASFIILFAFSISAAAWDWIMSIDAHWFSTMFSVYVFASLFVTSLATMTLISIYLKENGFLPFLNRSHLHDLGKFVFGFSIFWTYIWFCQYMLIWYANIPEETAYFLTRMGPDSPYKYLFFLNVIVNFLFPFLALMTSDSKRNYNYLAAVCGVLLIGHWLDLFMMIFPMVGNQTFALASPPIGLPELGFYAAYLGLFGLVVTYGLSRANIVPLHHPYLQETLHHHYGDPEPEEAHGVALHG